MYRLEYNLKDSYYYYPFIYMYNDADIAKFEVDAPGMCDKACVSP